MFKDGLARFATENYNSSINPDNLMMHLTNYAINKESEKFQENQADFKKTLQETLQTIAAIEGSERVEKLWDEIKDICLKTILVGLPHL